MLVRFLRLRDAPQYLGMDKNRFSREVRPYLTEIPIGKQGIAFDRLEMDAWADRYIERKGRPPKKLPQEGLRPGSAPTRASQSGSSEWEKAVEKAIATGRKRKKRK